VDRVIELTWTLSAPGRASDWRSQVKTCSRRALADTRKLRSPRCLPSWELPLVRQRSRPDHEKIFPRRWTTVTSAPNLTTSTRTSGREADEEHPVPASGMIVIVDRDRRRSGRPVIGSSMERRRGERRIRRSALFGIALGRASVALRCGVLSDARRLGRRLRGGTGPIARGEPERVAASMASGGMFSRSVVGGARRRSSP